MPVFPALSPYAVTVLTLDRVPDGEAFPVSATLFVTYRRCPQQALARLQGVYPAPSRATFRGALAHRVIARHIEDGPIDEDEFDLVCRRETGAGLNHQLASIGLKPSEFSTVVTEVGELYVRFRSMPLDGIAGHEVSFEDEVADGIVLRGRIDAVFDTGDGVRIVDWKTGADLGDEVTAQLGFYALAWEKRTGAPPATTEAMSLATGERVSTPVLRDDLERTEHQIAAMVTELRSAMARGGELARTGGPHCRWCPLLDDCGEGRSAIDLLG